jgi:hypothetical protein
VLSPPRATNPFDWTEAAPTTGARSSTVASATATALVLEGILFVGL